MTECGALIYNYKHLIAVVIVYFKVFAAVDSGPGRHVDDLMELKPSPDEMEKAALWAMTHDRSVEFQMVLVSMLRQMGFKDVAERI